MDRLFSVVFSILVAASVSGCASIAAPEYSALPDNVQTLKDKGSPAKVGEFTTDSPAVHPLSLRGGNKMFSPYGNSYGNYINEALKQELSLAKILAKDVDVEITGVLLANDIDIGGFSTGFTTISVNFVVKKSGQIAYSATKSIIHEFPSAFAAAVVIPRAVQEYTVSVQKLLTELYADPAFFLSLK